MPGAQSENVFEVLQKMVLGVQAPVGVAVAEVVLVERVVDGTVDVDEGVLELLRERLEVDSELVDNAADDVEEDVGSEEDELLVKIEELLVDDNNDDITEDIGIRLDELLETGKLLVDTDDDDVLEDVGIELDELLVEIDDDDVTEEEIGTVEETELALDVELLDVVEEIEDAELAEVLVELVEVAKDADSTELDEVLAEELIELDTCPFTVVRKMGRSIHCKSDAILKTILIEDLMK